jgi:lysophospholipase L1-like esterase
LKTPFKINRFMSKRKSPMNNGLRYSCILITHFFWQFASGQAPGTHYKFMFGTGKPVQGYTQVKPDTKYSNDTGYGFDFGTVPIVLNRKGDDPLTNGLCTSSKPFYFSVKLPEGNYHVRITMGDLKETASTTVKAESRRLMIEKVETPSGKFETRTFTVNVRVPMIAGTFSRVDLKPRELNKLDWDDKLTFEFNGKRPCINTIEISNADDVVTVYLAGNSTVVDQDDEPWASWGQMFPRFFKPGIAISNQAESGLSLGSFMSSKRFAKVLSTMKAGDYLFIEFGHNDQKEKGSNDGAFKSYSERLSFFIHEVKKKGGIPVVVTPANRRSFGEDGKIENSLDDYPDAARQVASREKVSLIDLNAMTKVFYETLGVDKSQKAFVIYPANTWPGQTEDFNDNTHFNGYGAYELTKCVIEGIKANQLDMAKFLIDSLPAFDPAHPDPVETFDLPISPKSSVIKPDGN